MNICLNVWKRKTGFNIDSYAVEYNAGKGELAISSRYVPFHIIFVYNANLFNILLLNPLTDETTIIKIDPNIIVNIHKQKIQEFLVNNITNALHIEDTQNSFPHFSL